MIQIWAFWAIALASLFAVVSGITLIFDYAKVWVSLLGALMVVLSVPTLITVLWWGIVA